MFTTDLVGTLVESFVGNLVGSEVGAADIVGVNVEKGAVVEGEALVGLVLVGDKLVGPLVVGDLLVGLLLVGDMLVGAVLVGDLVVGDRLVGEILEGDDVVGMLVDGDEVTTGGNVTSAPAFRFVKVLTEQSVEVQPSSHLAHIPVSASIIPWPEQSNRPSLAAALIINAYERTREANTLLDGKSGAV
jgi:hypothetical protein